MNKVDSVRYFGIRHHGPGSADCLVRSLDELNPVAVLIEGPSDATEALPMLADPSMKPPVALLCYPEDDTSQTGFWPFAEFSPEYQATLWAVRHGVPVRFIDLPSCARTKTSAPAEDDENKAPEEVPPEYRDPIGILAEAAGYGRSWNGWNKKRRKPYGVRWTDQSAPSAPASET